jgi:Ca2+:H+ antiporter
VTPVLVLFSQLATPKPMDLIFGGGQVLMVLLTTLTVAFVTSTGHSAWYTGVQLLSVYAVFAVALYLIPS